MPLLILIAVPLGTLGTINSLAAGDPLIIANTAIIGLSGEIGIFWDILSYSEVNFINWGTLNESSDYTITVYVRNFLATPQMVTFGLGNWTPTEMNNYINVTWTFGAEPLYPSRPIRQVDITLSVGNVPPELYPIPEKGETVQFSFDITIYREEAI